MTGQRGILFSLVILLASPAWAGSIEERYLDVLEPCGQSGTEAERIVDCTERNAEAEDANGVPLEAALRGLPSPWSLVAVTETRVLRGFGCSGAEVRPVAFWRDDSEGGKLWSSAIDRVKSWEEAAEVCRTHDFSDVGLRQGQLGLPELRDLERSVERTTGLAGLLDHVRNPDWVWTWDRLRGRSGRMWATLVDVLDPWSGHVERIPSVMIKQGDKVKWQDFTAPFVVCVGSEKL